MKIKGILFIILFFFYSTFLFSEDTESRLLKTAINFENQGKIEDAIKTYKKIILISKNKNQIEKTQLKIARMIPDYNDSVKEYEQFLEQNPSSRYRFLARFELATLHKIKKNYVSSLKEFYKIAELSKGTPYWQKSLIEASFIESELNNFKQGIKNLYKVLEEVEDYEDIGVSYFLLGILTEKQKLFDDAEQFFLICAGSFPQCSKAPASLFELEKMYLSIDKKLHAKRISLLIEQLYTDSPENNEAKKIIKNIIIDKNEKLPEIELLNLNEDQTITKKSISRLIEDLNLSIEISEEKKSEISAVKSGFYVQLGYFSQLDNANQIIENCKDKQIKGVFLTKVKGKNDKIFYKILIGPFKSSSDANNKLIELKENNIEAIIVELTKDYE